MNLPAVLPINEVVPLEVKGKQFILCITKDLSIEDKALFGKLDLLEYEDRIHKNIPIETLDFDVLIMDLREQSDRYAYIKEVKPKKEKYNVVCYCYNFEKDEDNF